MMLIYSLIEAPTLTVRQFQSNIGRAVESQETEGVIYISMFVTEQIRAHTSFLIISPLRERFVSKGEVVCIQCVVTCGIY
jgi:hypothetical protein